MSNQPVTRPDHLLIITSSPKSTGRGQVKNGANVRLAVSKGTGGDSNSIAIDTYEGYLGTAQRRETALINITFADRSVWSGTFDELKASLQGMGTALSLLSKIDGVLIEQLDDDYKENPDIIEIMEETTACLKLHGRN